MLEFPMTVTTSSSFPIYLVLVNELVHHLLNHLLLLDELVLRLDVVANLVQVPGDHLENH